MKWFAFVFVNICIWIFQHSESTWWSYSLGTRPVILTMWSDKFLTRFLSRFHRHWLVLLPPRPLSSSWPICISYKLFLCLYLCLILYCWNLRLWNSIWNGFGLVLSASPAASVTLRGSDQWPLCCATATSDKYQTNTNTKKSNTKHHSQSYGHRIVTNSDILNPAHSSAAQTFHWNAHIAYRGRAN